MNQFFIACTCPSRVSVERALTIVNLINSAARNIIELTQIWFCSIFGQDTAATFNAQFLISFQGPLLLLLLLLLLGYLQCVFVCGRYAIPFWYSSCQFPYRTPQWPPFFLTSTTNVGCTRPADESQQIGWWSDTEVAWILNKIQITSDLESYMKVT